MKYKAHPLADLFPEMPVAELATLTASVKAHGLLTPITLLDGKILDGRHRYHACLTARVEPQFVEYTGDDPVGFVIAANLDRRHLSQSERAAVAAEIATLKHGQKRADIRPANLPVSQAEAAKTLNISERIVRDAAKVKNEDPKLFAKIKSGELTVNAATKQMAQAKPDSEPAPEVDKTGWPIPPALLPIWARRGEMLAIASKLSDFKCAVAKGIEDGDPLWKAVTNTLPLDFANLYGAIKLAMPFAVCPRCQGKLPKGCLACKEVGLVSEFFWNRCVPKEDKQMRETLINQTK